MTGTTRLMTILLAGALSACGSSEAMDTGGEKLVIRNLVETEVAAPHPDHYKIQGELIPTPSDDKSQYYLLRQRKTMAGTNIAIMRQERGDKVAYARTEVDCGQRLFHVVGVANSRIRVESDAHHDGPLRSIEGLPLRQELANYVCQKSGTPLAA
jgi:hypothetical protein